MHRIHPNARGGRHAAADAIGGKNPIRTCQCNVLLPPNDRSPARYRVEHSHPLSVQRPPSMLLENNNERAPRNASFGVLREFPSISSRQGSFRELYRSLKDLAATRQLWILPVPPSYHRYQLHNLHVFKQSSPISASLPDCCKFYGRPWAR